MHQGKYVFSQLMDQVVRYQFKLCVARYQGDYWMKHLSCWEQFLAMAFGQLTFRESLRDIAVCLAAQRDKFYHLGFRSPVVRTTLAYANERRDWRIYRDYATVLIAEARALYGAELPPDLDLDGAVYIIDSTTIELCLSLFPWARLVKRRASIKLNLELSLSGNIPSFFDFSSGKEHDTAFLDRLVIEPGAHYVFDRGYIDFARWRSIHEAGAFFVSRAKDNLDFRRLYSGTADKESGVTCDQTIVLAGYYSAQGYPDKLRRIKYIDYETSKRYVFLTNDFASDAELVARLYKYRWQIELFFKWIKQHLSVKAFWGRSENAVKTQVCIALCAYLLVAIMKKRLKIDRNTYEILQILSVSMFDKIPLRKLISKYHAPVIEPEREIQANLWGN
jgi:hypothetical protein